MTSTYGPRDLAAARRYVRRVVARRSFTDRPSKPPAAWSPTYLLRQANRWRRDEAAGVKPALRAGRGHPAPIYYPGTTRPIGLARSGVRSSEHRRAQETANLWRQPPYRSIPALKRFVMSHAWRPGQFLILSAYGRLREGYVAEAKSRVFADRWASPQRRKEAEKAEGGNMAWRNMWYGPVDELPGVLDALNDATSSADDVLESLEEDYPGMRAFEPGSIILWEVSWSKG